MKVNLTPVQIGLAVAVGAGLLYFLKKKADGLTISGAAAAVGAGAVSAADGIFSGAVKGVGSLVGIPDTSVSQCERDKAAGNAWDASFSCSAGDFLSYAWGSVTGSTSTQASNTRYERPGATGKGESSVYDWSLSSSGPSQGSFASGMTFKPFSF